MRNIRQWIGCVLCAMAMMWVCNCAMAQLATLGAGGLSGSGSGCTNSLNFAQACNSQYMPAL